MGKIYVVTNKSLDTAVAATIASVVFQKAEVEYEIQSFDEYEDFENLINHLIHQYSGFKLILLDVKPQKELVEKLNIAKHDGTIEYLEMYNHGSSGVYTEWSHDSRRTVSEQFVSNNLIEETINKVDPKTHRLLSSLVHAIADGGQSCEDLNKIYEAGLFVSYVSEYILEKASEDKSEAVADNKCPRYIHYTHSDLDAAGCTILLDVCYGLGGDKYEHRYCKNPTDCAEQIKVFLEEEMEDGVEYNIVISDISIKDESVADALDAAFRSGKIARLNLFDHHPTAVWMDKKYPWCRVETYHITGINTKINTCGTLLMYDFFGDIVQKLVTNPLIDALVDPYVEIIRLYDTYDWKQVGDYGKVAYNHNTIFNKYGMEKYVSIMVSRILKGEDVRRFTAEEEEIIKAEDEAFEAYLDECRKRLVARTGMLPESGPFKYGTLFCSRYTSEIGNRLSIENPELAFIAMVNIEKMKVEIRTARDDFNTSEFAKINGGGGHPKASGFPLDYKDLSDMIKVLRE